MNEVNSNELEQKDASAERSPRIRMKMKLVRGAGIGMVALSSTGLALTLVGSSTWYVDAASYWIPAYAALSLAGAACCLAARSRIWAASGMACLCCAMALLAPCYRQVHEADGLTPNLRILQANVYEYNNDPSPFLQLIRDTKPDVVMLQEADPKWKKLLQPLDSLYPRKAFAPRYPNNEIDLGQFWTADSDDPKELADKGLPATQTTLRIGGRPVNLLNVHTAAPFSPQRGARHREQMLALAQYAAGLDGPVILAGDLNSGFWSSLYRQLARTAKLVNARQGLGVLGTWPSFFGPLRTGIDQMLVSPDIQVVRCWVGPGIGSDHRPLITDLYVPPANSGNAIIARRPGSDLSLPSGHGIVCIGAGITGTPNSRF